MEWKPYFLRPHPEGGRAYQPRFVFHMAHYGPGDAERHQGFQRGGGGGGDRAGGGGGEGGDDDKKREVTVRKHLTTFNGFMRESQNDLFRPFNKERVLLQPHYNYMRHMAMPSVQRTGPSMGICTHYMTRGYIKPMFRARLNTAVWSGNGKFFICGTEAGTFLIWEGSTFKFDRKIDAHFYFTGENNMEKKEVPIRDMAWGHFGQLMMSADNNGRVHYYNASLQKAGAGVTAHDGSCRGVSFSPSDAKFVSCGDDNTVKVWDVGASNEGKPAEVVYDEHKLEVTGCAWHPNRALLLSCSKDLKAKLWDPRSPESVATVFAHKKHINCCGWSTGGNYFATGSKDLSAKVFDVRALGRDEAVQTLTGHGGSVTCLGWHPMHDRLLTTGSFNGSMAYWTLGEGQGMHTGIDAAHRNNINFIKWHPAGHQLATASFEGALKLWTREQPGGQCDPEVVSIMTNQGPVEERMTVGYGPLPAPEEPSNEEPVSVSLARGIRADQEITASGAKERDGRESGHSGHGGSGGSGGGGERRPSRAHSSRGGGDGSRAPQGGGGDYYGNGGNGGGGGDGGPSGRRGQRSDAPPSSGGGGAGGSSGNTGGTDFASILAKAKSRAAAVSGGVPVSAAPAPAAKNVSASLASLVSKFAAPPPPPPPAPPAPPRKKGRYSSYS